MRLETLAVSKLMERMVNNGASLEELKKVADYIVTAAVYDEMTVNLYDVAEKNGIKELVKKYPPRFSWLGSSDTSAKELLNLNHGVPKHEYDFSKTKVGDKITVDLKELGKFEATAHFNNACEWGWLRNAMKKEYSSAGFVSVSSIGAANYTHASYSGGVRPYFRLKK